MLKSPLHASYKYMYIYIYMCVCVLPCLDNLERLRAKHSAQKVSSPNTGCKMLETIKDIHLKHPQTLCQPMLTWHKQCRPLDRFANRFSGLFGRNTQLRHLRTASSRTSACEREREVLLGVPPALSVAGLPNRPNRHEQCWCLL